MWILRGLVGLAVLTALAWALSENRRRVQWKVVGWGLGLQFAFALLLVKVPVFQQMLGQLNRVVRAVEQASHSTSSWSISGSRTSSECAMLARSTLVLMSPTR